MARWLPGSLSARITVGFMILVLSFGGISVWTIGTLKALNRATRITNAGYLQLALVSGDLDSSQKSLRSYLKEELGEQHSRRWARKRLQGLLDARSRELARMREILDEVSRIEGADAGLFGRTASLVDGIAKLIDDSQDNYEKLLDNPPIALREGEEPSAAYEDVLKLKKRQLRAELQISQLTGQLKDRERKVAIGLADKLDKVFREAWMFTLLFGGLAVVLGVAITIGATLTLRPLQRLRDAAARIAAGDYEQRIPVQGPREISDLATEFNVMGQAIQERSRELVRTERLATAGKMAAMITHEVRNPLSSIGLNTELLEEELSELPSERASEAQALCRAITTEVDRLTEITEEYLQLTRLPQPRRQPESLGKIVDSVVSFVREQLRSRGAEIESVLPEGPNLLLDEGQIRQALLNLLRNAADAMADQGGGRIRIELRHESDYSELVVADEGPGISDELIERVFEAFVSSKSSGTGLGLALTRQIVGDHGAHIEVRNGEEGGAIFSIRFPHEE